MKLSSLLPIVVIVFTTGCAELAYDSLHQEQARKERESGLVVGPHQQSSQPSYEEYMKEREEFLKKEAQKKKQQEIIEL